MHIAQEMLNGSVCPVTAVISAAIVGVSAYFAVKSKNKPDAAKFFKVMALIFVMQMLNFPIQSGTSGHFLGGSFAVLILGTPFAVVAMSIVLTIQTLLFGDGGINALGANILNMAVIGTMIPGIILTYLKSKNSIKNYGIIALTGFFAVVAASFACAVEVGISGVFTMEEGIKAMSSVHIGIGAVEGIITVLLYAAATKGVLRTREYIILMAVLIIASPFANSNPDGLEWVIEKIGETGELKYIYKPLFNDYTFEMVKSSYLSTVISALAGVVSCYVFTSFIYLKKKNR